MSEIEYSALQRSDFWEHIRALGAARQEPRELPSALGRKTSSCSRTNLAVGCQRSDQRRLILTNHSRLATPGPAHKVPPKDLTVVTKREITRGFSHFAHLRRPITPIKQAAKSPCLPKGISPHDAPGFDRASWHQASNVWSMAANVWSMSCDATSHARRMKKPALSWGN